MRPFENLKAWKSAYELALAVYKATDSFPKSEMYGLTAQLRRAAVSVHANIAEGYPKLGSREFRRYVDIARGSLSEIASLLLMARDVGFLAPERWKELDALQSRVGRLTWGLCKWNSAGGRNKP